MDPAPISRRRVLALATFVFAIAIAVRLRCLSESFWVDELHSAWTVWGSWADVFSRSSAGHQSPIYFAGLWLWKQLFGGSEFAMRLSSVIPVAAASVVMVVGIARATRSLLAGTVAGLVLALESNALFFGTELRPYSVVILLSAFATVCFVQIMVDGESRREGIVRLGLLAAVILSVLVQPTSIGVMVCFPAALFFSGRWQVGMNRLGILTLVVIAVAVLFLWVTTLGDSWDRRGDWASFATATDFGQFWKAWDWVWLVMVPLGLAVPRSTSRRITWTLALIAIVATAIYWTVSWSGWVPIWHRRYFVAVLPVLAAVVGGSVASISSRNAPLGWIGASAILVGLTVQQNTLPRLWRNPTRGLVVRGEDWRSAVRWINEKRSDGDRVFLDGGLIEGQTNSYADEKNGQSEYLSFPVRGPYRVSGMVVPVDANLRGISSVEFSETFILTRRPANRLTRDAHPSAEIAAFGGVSVMKLPAAVDGGLK